MPQVRPDPLLIKGRRCSQVSDIAECRCSAAWSCPKRTVGDAGTEHLSEP
ncbi:MAG: hypothetical protein WC364_00865 [Eubacteriales bacterium]